MIKPLSNFAFNLNLRPCNEATYETPTAGGYEVSILYYGRHLQGSPYQVRRCTFTGAYDPRLTPVGFNA